MFAWRTLLDVADWHILYYRSATSEKQNVLKRMRNLRIQIKLLIHKAQSGLFPAATFYSIHCVYKRTGKALICRLILAFADFIWPKTHFAWRGHIYHGWHFYIRLCNWAAFSIMIHPRCQEYFPIVVLVWQWCATFYALITVRFHQNLTTQYDRILLDKMHRGGVKESKYNWCHET